MPMPEIRLGVAKTVSIAESLEIQKTVSVRMKEAMAKQAADRLSKSQTKTEEIGKSEMLSRNVGIPAWKNCHQPRIATIKSNFAKHD